MKIISGSSNRRLASILARKLNIELLETRINKFQDGELKVQISGKIGREVIILQSTCTPVNDNLMELLLLADAAKRAGADRITAIIPYFGYSRQNLAFQKNSPISASLVIKMIGNAGITEVITLDLHSSQLEGIFNVPIRNLASVGLFLPKIAKLRDVIIVSPDIGGIPRAKNYSSRLGSNLAIIDKTRSIDTGTCIIEGIIGNVKDKNCVIIDDIVDSGGTLCLAAELLLGQGAKSVEAFITHGVFSGNAISRINNSDLEKLYISDSITLKEKSDKIIQLSIDELILENI